MHAFLITGGRPEARQAKIEDILQDWQVTRFDQVKLVPETTSIGIGQIRRFEKQLWLKPYSSVYTVGIIGDAQLLTIEAQQALLKTLEEPPDHVRFILETGNPQTLAPTIISRCQIINLGTPEMRGDKESSHLPKTLSQISHLSAGQRLQLVDTIAPDRETALNWMDQAIVVAHDMLLSDKSLAEAKILRALLRARLQLTANVNPKLILDHFFLQNF